MIATILDAVADDYHKPQTEGGHEPQYTTCEKMPIDPKTLTLALSQHSLETVDAIIKRWEKFGLLGGLDGFAKQKCALYFDAVARQLVDYKTGERHEDMFRHMVFPVIRRLNQVTTHFNLGDLMNGLYKYLAPIYDWQQDGYVETENNLYDLEAEVCSMYCDTILGELLKFPRKV